MMVTVGRLAILMNGFVVTGLNVRLLFDDDGFVDFEFVRVSLVIFFPAL